MAKWEQYPYLCDLELLHDYVPDEEVTIFVADSKESYKKRFKEWRGIVSSVHSHVTDGKASAVVLFCGKVLIIDIYEDKNSTVQCYPFQHYVNWKAVA